MAHALGGLENKYIYSNCLEGLNQSIDKGYKLIETDLILTKDNKLVCFHGWNEATYQNTGLTFDNINPIMTYEEFMKSKIQGKYTTIDISVIVEYLLKYSNIYFEFDLRTLDKNTAVKTAVQLLNAFQNHEDLLNRVIVQVGSKAMYEGMELIYHFKNYQYFIHESELKKLDNLLLWIKDNGIISVAVKYSNLNQQRILKIRGSGIYLLAHTIDDIELAKSLLDMGVNIICTNFITINELE